jgi:hypothetical protein
MHSSESARHSAQGVGCLTKKLPCAVAEGSLSIQFLVSLYRSNNHIFKQYLKRHGVAASFMGNEKFAIAVENAVIIGNMVFTIVAMKIKVKLIEVEAVSILSVTFCLFYLTYQSRIHCINLLF